LSKKHAVSLISKQQTSRLGSRSKADNQAAVRGLQGSYKDGLQPESLADGNWLVKQYQPVSKIETKSDTNLRSLYESWFRNALISKSVILWWQNKKVRNKFRARRSKHTQSLKTFLQRGLCISCAARTLQHTCKRKALCFLWHASHLELLHTHTHIYHKC